MSEGGRMTTTVLRLVYADELEMALEEVAGDLQPIVDYLRDEADALARTAPLDAENMRRLSRLDGLVRDLRDVFETLKWLPNGLAETVTDDDDDATEGS